MPSKDWKEEVPADETARFERHAQTLLELQRARAKKYPVSRALHAKAQAGVEAELTMLPDLPEHARQRLFERPASYRAYVRSTGLAAVRPTTSRKWGIAMRWWAWRGRS